MKDEIFLHFHILGTNLGNWNGNYFVVLVNKYTIDPFLDIRRNSLKLYMRASPVYQFRRAQCASVRLRTGSTLTAQSQSMIRTHKLTCNSPILLDNIIIIGSTSNNIYLRFLESLLYTNRSPFLINYRVHFHL